MTDVVFARYVVGAERFHTVRTGGGHEWSDGWKQASVCRSCPAEGGEEGQAAGRVLSHRLVSQAIIY